MKPPRTLNSASEIIAEIERELVMRGRVYPRLVEQGKLSDFQRHKRIDCMRDVLAIVRGVFADALEAERLL